MANGLKNTLSFRINTSRKQIIFKFNLLLALVRFFSLSNLKKNLFFFEDYSFRHNI